MAVQRASEAGTFYPVGYDETNNVTAKIFVVRLSDDERKDVLKRYGKKQFVKATGTHQRTIPTKRQAEANRAYAIKCWTDTLNYYVLMDAEGELGFWSKEVGEKLSLNQEVKLDGRLSDGIKQYLLKRDVGLVSFIIEKGLGVDETDVDDEDEDEEEEQLEKNSSGSSSSASATPTSESGEK